MDFVRYRQVEMGTPYLPICINLDKQVFAQVYRRDINIHLQK